MDTAPSYEVWRADFRHRVKEHLLRQRMTQNDLARAIGYRDSSGVNYHLAGKGPSEEFIRRIAELWPDLFGNEMELFLAAKHGRLPGEGVSSLHQRNILMALDSLDAALTVVRKAFLKAFENAENDEQGETGEGG